MRSKARNTLISLSAFGAGICNGLLGAGGGILLVLALSRLSNDKFSDSRDVYVNAQAAMLPVTAVSCLIYGFRGMMNTDSFTVYAIPALLGGITGGVLLSRINSSWIKRLFAILVVWSGVRMML